MAIVAAQLAGNPRARRAAWWGCLLMFGLPLAVVCLMITAFLVADDTEAAPVKGANCAPGGANASQVGPWSGDQMTNATTIVVVGRQQQIPDQGIVVALMAAMVESRLRNLPYGDRDSLGLFQMRPSQGWGTVAQLTDPAYAAAMFYAALTAVPDWQGIPPGNAAQAVERSALPDQYAKFEDDARQVVGALSGTACATWKQGSGSTGGSSGGGSARAQKVIAAAMSQRGVPYAWAGGTAQGPSPGTGADAGVVGFDCSGLALYAYAQVGISVPHQTQAIWATFQPAVTDPGGVQPGDLILLSSNGTPGGIHHVGIYLGNGQVVHSPESGDVVKVTDNIWAPGSYWARQFIGAVRPGA
ncbi:C40 family peptidase [Amycolatopsis sp. GM8]|uniref:C40 family peptidase n=1 Tax=Amycolatopsis sp. GM8 TaxID=2896530 RepID=UPI001F48ABCD|nr:C40 family peptidase [Amycolatopsis sp. GM8]